MTPEQAQRLKKIGERTDGIRHLVTDKPYMVDYSVVDRQFLYDLLQSIIVERDEARKFCKFIRARVNDMGTGNSMSIGSYPWEKDAT